MSYNNFNKQLLTRYVESECKRQLFLDLAYAMPEKWYTDDRKIEKPEKIRKMPKLLVKLGKKYEQKVYSRLKLIKGAHFNLDHKDRVDETYLNPSLFTQLYEELKESPITDFILLEHQFEVPDSFLDYIFPPKEGIMEVPVNYGEQRPDIMVIGTSNSKKEDEVFELLNDGIIRKVPESELNSRYGINIIDIKNTREDHVGKKQFIEIFYYLWTLSYYLKQYKLDDKFFVHIDYNGIFPQYNEEELLNLRSFEDLFELTIEIRWDESIQVFIDTIEKIKKLWFKAPLPIESTSVNIQPSCGYCYFIEDCKKSLGMDGVKEPKDWSLKLIPCTSMSIAQQLVKLGFQTISDVADRINKTPVGNTPNPLYSELPLLENKALALVNDKVVFPRPGHTHTYTLPKFSPIAITFAVETDPANERVYAAGFFLQMSTFASAPFSGVFDKW